MRRVINAVRLIGIFGLRRTVFRANLVSSDRLLVGMRRKSATLAFAATNFTTLPGLCG